MDCLGENNLPGNQEQPWAERQSSSSSSEVQRLLSGHRVLPQGTGRPTQLAPEAHDFAHQQEAKMTLNQHCQLLSSPSL